MELDITSESLYSFEVVIDHESLFGHAQLLYKSLSNTTFTATVLKLDDNGEKMDVPIYIVGTRFFLDGIPYAMRMPGQHWDFCCCDLHNSDGLLTITIEMEGWTSITYDFYLDIIVIHPE